MEIENAISNKTALSTEKGGLRGNSDPYLVGSCHLQGFLGFEQMFPSRIFIVSSVVPDTPPEFN